MWGRTCDGSQKRVGGPIPATLERRKGHWAGSKKCPRGLLSAGIPASPHADAREVPGRFNHTVTQMSQHDYRERIIVEACGQFSTEGLRIRKLKKIAEEDDNDNNKNK